ncbi:FAD-binding protein [Effusibacillus dendaii]|uniref:Fumarate reductase subunit A n=1 Tax=Effusibacillus dendaii TaxID=2743772 RepID=A0A7I8D9X0_9BACL|nr:FAD-binding protein [Effusibacillus dendaii]BCJ85626.1 fumarate reductase subunit A [Effusibacillus dendaii]
MSNLKIAREIDADVLVVGGGGAATRAALSAKQEGADVRMAVKSKWLKSGSTATAFSELLSIAAAIGHGDERDHPEIHFSDTMKSGEGFIDPDLVWGLAHEAPDRIFDLIELGLDFDKQQNGKLVQGMSDFATYPRTCRVNGVTARHILNILAKRLKELNVPVDQDMMIFDIMTDESQKVIGALGWDHAAKELVLYRTPAVIFACGGSHSVYKYGVGTSEMTGDGYAMAYKLGLPLVNMEFVQIGPAALFPSVTLLSGPVWKTNPILMNGKGESIFANILPEGVSVEEVYQHKVFPFSVSNVSFYLDTSIQREMETNPTPRGGVWYQKRPGTDELIESKMPKTKRVLKSKGIELDDDKFEIGLISQCNNGGVQILNMDCETDISGLYVAGETAGGLRGPDRPGGNSLAEGQVFGHRAGIASARYAKQLGAKPQPQLGASITLDSYNSWLQKCANGTKSVQEAADSVRAIMHKNCLVIRSEQRLSEAWNFLCSLESELQSGEFYVDEGQFYQAVELNHMIIAAKIIVRSALERKESRSCHYREDYPEKNDNEWKKSIRVRCVNGEMRTELYCWPTVRKRLG